MEDMLHAMYHQRLFATFDVEDTFDPKDIVTLDLKSANKSSHSAHTASEIGSSIV
jgi:hypothetical protein